MSEGTVDQGPWTVDFRPGKIGTRGTGVFQWARAARAMFPFTTASGSQESVWEEFGGAWAWAGMRQLEFVVVLLIAKNSFPGSCLPSCPRRASDPGDSRVRRVQTW